MANGLNGEHSKVCSHKTKIPIDVRIVAYFLYAIGFIQLVLSILLITGIGRLGDNHTRRVLFGIILLSSELDFTIYMLCLSFVHLLCGWGLIRKCKFIWWFTLIFQINYIIDGVFLFEQHKLVALIGLGIDIAIITWLCFRRQLYNVGFK